MTKPASNLRLFVAVYPPPELVDAWTKLVRRLDLPPGRLTPREQVHLTLQFVGDTPVKALEHTIESVRRSTKGLDSFELVARRLIRLPERGPARLVAVETDAPSTLLELQRRLAFRLATAVRPEPGRRFRPHLTICRFKPPVGLGGIDVEVEPQPFAVDQISLMRSTLRLDGAVHEVIETIRLA